MAEVTKYETREAVATQAYDPSELTDEQLETIAGGLMDPLINIGDQNLCLNGGLVNTKMEINL